MPSSSSSQPEAGQLHRAIIDEGAGVIGAFAIGRNVTSRHLEQVARQAGTQAQPG